MPSPATPETLQVRVMRARLLNPLIRELRLRADAGVALPGFGAGAHVRVQVRLADGSTDWRHYSLVDLSGTSHAAIPVDEYVIAVRRESDGRGGSRFMHEQVTEGDWLTIEPPRNDFELAAPPGAALLVAGGIGITPLATMAAQCRTAGRPVRMVYAGRDRASMAYLSELQALLGADLRVHADAEAGRPLDVEALLDTCDATEQLHVCGPGALLTALQAQTAARGWAPERLRFEVFTPAGPASDDRPFELVLAASGRTLTVPADRTILEVLSQAGCDPLFDCGRGECGICAVTVIDGGIDHRDHVLTQRERAAGNVIQVCVSRATGPRLVLDL